jgi:hypothetical protein
MNSRGRSGSESKGSESGGKTAKGGGKQLEGIFRGGEENIKGFFSLGIEGWRRSGDCWRLDNEIKAVFCVLRHKLIICPRRGPSLSKHPCT